MEIEKISLPLHTKIWPFCVAKQSRLIFLLTCWPTPNCRHGDATIGLGFLVSTMLLVAANDDDDDDATGEDGRVGGGRTQDGVHSSARAQLDDDNDKEEELLGGTDGGVIDHTY
jgi:hypothetical protein